MSRSRGLTKPSTTPIVLQPTRRALCSCSRVCRVPSRAALSSYGEWTVFRIEFNIAFNTSTPENQPIMSSGGGEPNAVDGNLDTFAQTGSEALPRNPFLVVRLDLGYNVTRTVEVVHVYNADVLFQTPPNFPSDINELRYKDGSVFFVSVNLDKYSFNYKDALGHCRSQYNANLAYIETEEQFRWLREKILYIMDDWNRHIMDQQEGDTYALPRLPLWIDGYKDWRPHDKVRYCETLIPGYDLSYGRTSSECQKKNLFICMRSLTVHVVPYYRFGGPALQTAPRCDLHKGRYGNASVHYCEPGMQGTHVAVILGGAQLTVAEVEVYSDSNLAYKKRAYQSRALNQDGTARMAVDGHRDTSPHLYGWTMTKTVESLWWAVDLAANTKVQLVKIYRPRPTHEPPSHQPGIHVAGFPPVPANVSMHVTDHLTDLEDRRLEDTLCVKLDGPLRELTIVNCQPRSGRYVLLWTHSAGRLVIMEVEVFTNRRNYALGGEALQASHHGNVGGERYTNLSGWKGNAVDDWSASNLDVLQGHCALVAYRATEPWWMVDLQARHLVATVTVYTTNKRFAWWGDSRLEDYAVSLLETFVYPRRGSMPGQPCVTHRGPTYGKEELKCTPDAVWGRWVLIKVLVGLQRSMTLCEVHIFAKDRSGFHNNLAYKKPTFATVNVTDYSMDIVDHDFLTVKAGAAASRAVDGNRSPYRFRDFSCIFVSRRDVWMMSWSVNFGRKLLVEYVTMYNEQNEKSATGRDCNAEDKFSNMRSTRMTSYIDLSGSVHLCRSRCILNDECQAYEYSAAGRNCRLLLAPVPARLMETRRGTDLYTLHRCPKFLNREVEITFRLGEVQLNLNHMSLVKDVCYRFKGLFGPQLTVECEPPRLARQYLYIVLSSWNADLSFCEVEVYGISAEDTRVFEGAIGHLALYDTPTYSTNPPTHLFKQDCLREALGVNYTGTQSITRSGRRCQAWASQTPHKHPYEPPLVQFPDENFADAANYCRNPWTRHVGQHYDPLGPWCYTTHSDLRFDYCSIPLCSQYFPDWPDL